MHDPPPFLSDPPSIHAPPARIPQVGFEDAAFDELDDLKDSEIVFNCESKESDASKRLPRSQTSASILKRSSSQTIAHTHTHTRATIHFMAGQEEHDGDWSALLEDLGMVIPRAVAPQLDYSQVLSGDISVGQAIKSKNSNSRDSIKKRASRTSVVAGRQSIKQESSHGGAREGRRSSVQSTSSRMSLSHSHKRTSVHGRAQSPSHLDASMTKVDMPPLLPELGDERMPKIDTSRHPELACGIARQNLLAAEEAALDEPHVGATGQHHHPPSLALERMKRSTLKIISMTRFTSGKGKTATGNKRGDRMIVVQGMISMPLFKWCNFMFLHELAATAEEKTFPAGGTILWGLSTCFSSVEGDAPGPHMVIVHRGSARVVIDEHEVQRLSAGEHFGETVLLGVRQDWGATLRTEANAAVLVLYRKQLQKALQFFETEQDLFEDVQWQHKECDDCNAKDGILTKRCAIFNGLSEESMQSLHEKILSRIYFPGHKILEEGQPGDELYILVRGIVGVEIMGRVVRQERRDSETIQNQHADQQPVCFGELGLLGMQHTRSASVVAQTVCHMRVLYRPVFSSTLSKCGDSIRTDDMMKFLSNRYKENQKPAIAILKEVDVFQQVGCSDRFLDFLSKHMEERILLAGQMIIDETGPEHRCMFLLAEGLAKVTKGNKVVAKLSSGAVFGVSVVMGLSSKRAASVIAVETCYVQVLAQSIVVRGLELFPEERGKVLMLAFGATASHSDPQPTTRESVSPVALQGVVSDGRKDERKKIIKPAWRSSSQHAAFLKALKKASLFASIDPGFVEDLGAVAHDRIYMPGESVIEEGMRGDSMFIMVSGQATVFVTDPDTAADKQVASFLASQQKTAGRSGSKEEHRDDASMSGSPKSQKSPASAKSSGHDHSPRNPKSSFLHHHDHHEQHHHHHHQEHHHQSHHHEHHAHHPHHPHHPHYPHHRFADAKKEHRDTVLNHHHYSHHHHRKVMSKIGLLTAGSICGELAMLGVALVRSATIEAQTICSMWEITQENALTILEKYPDAQTHFAKIIVEHLERTVPLRILQAPLFQGFDRKFRMLLGLYCDRKAYFSGQKICREGQTGERLYIVNQGRATLEKKSVIVKTYSAGTYFGSGLMLGIHKVYVGTLAALQTCHILGISRQAYLQALEQYPSHQAAQELKKKEKEACEELLKAIQRISARKLIFKRYQFQLLDAQNPDAARLSQTELLYRAWRVWSEWSKRVVQKRKQLEIERRQYKDMMNHWVQKRDNAREALRLKEAEELPDLRPNTMSCRPSPRKKQLGKVLEDWPAPRPSPHYRLRVFGVLHEAVVKRPTQGATLLPLLQGLKETRGAKTESDGFYPHSARAGNTAGNRKVTTAPEHSKADVVKSDQKPDQWWRGNPKEMISSAPEFHSSGLHSGPEIQTPDPDDDDTAVAEAGELSHHWWHQDGSIFCNDGDGGSVIAFSSAAGSERDEVGDGSIDGNDSIADSEVFVDGELA